MVQKAASNAKRSTDKEVTNTVTNSKRSRAVAVVQSEDDESDDVVEEKPMESKKNEANLNERQTRLKEAKETNRLRYC